MTWSLFIRCAPFPTKASLLHEAKLREDESGRTSKLLDWYVMSYLFSKGPVKQRLE